MTETTGAAGAEGAGLPVALPVAQLRRTADLAGLTFATSADLTPITGLVSQARAEEALRFGAAVAARGFNIFAIGASTAGVQQAVQSVLSEVAATRPAAPDWVYVNNFAAPSRPVALRLPPCRAPAFQQAMHHLIDDLKVAIPGAFEAEDYQARRGAIEESFRTKNEEAFSTLGEHATARGLVVVRTPMGFAVAPAKDGQVMPPDKFAALDEAERHTLQQAITETEHELELTVRGLPRLEKERRDAVRTLNRETARAAVGQMIEEARAPFADLPKVQDHFAAVSTDLVENVQLFIGAQAGGSDEATMMAQRLAAALGRYEVNVLVTQAGDGQQAPVVEELHPTLPNLLGRVEYTSEQGVLSTDFRLIKAGALHRANGGALMIDARSLLSEPFSWAALKRAMVRQEILIEDVTRFLGLNATVSLQPDPIPLDVKVVLFGERVLYYLLSALDPDFAQHFKVLADFNDSTERTAASEEVMARLAGTLAAHDSALPLDRGAVAGVIEHAARRTGDQAKLSLVVEDIHDLIAEANHLAGAAGRGRISREDVDEAIARQLRRAGRAAGLMREMVLRDIALVATSGSAVGQINGLAVFSLGAHAFGSPARITCRVRPGGGRIVDIEREADLGGHTHSKGVLILTGFLAGRYALDVPMSVYASLVFEQSYGGVDGDSASSTELYALLSALAEAPLRQDLAVTGSVNQHGIVQAIGGVNEKIEGFFDICAARGLTGTQGVMIPAANAQHLMLRPDIVAACAEGKFTVYAAHTIDEGIALLTGQPAGVRGADGTYPEGSINRRVEDRLRGFAEIRRRHGESEAEEAAAAKREHPR
jgi:predicted ATP-dependent protease